MYITISNHPIPNTCQVEVNIPSLTCPRQCRPQRVHLHLCHHLWKLRQNTCSHAGNKFLRSTEWLFLFLPLQGVTLSCRVLDFMFSIVLKWWLIWSLALVGVNKAYWRRALEPRTSSSLLCSTAGWPSVGIPTSKSRLFYWHYSATCDWHLWEDLQKAWTTCL